MAETAPTREIGYAQTSTMSASTSNTNWWAFEDETTPELRWPQSVYVYDQMRRTDAQVASVLRAVSLPVRRTPWRIDPAGARAEVVQLVAEDLGLPIVGKPVEPLPRARDRFSWLEHLREALLMLPFGHMYFEQNVRIVDGKARLRKLAPRMPKTIEEIRVARDGGLEWIKQYSTNSVTQPPIPVDRLVAYILDREAGNWLGSSLLRPAYKHWLIKDRLLRVQAQTIERNGMGIPTYTAAETEKDLSHGLGLATNLRSGEAAGAALPFGATLRLLGVEGTLPDAQPAIDYHDSQIARAVLAHFLNLGTQTGSWALGTTFADFFTLSLQTLAQQVADVATQHVVEDMVDWNFGENEPAPKIVFDEIGSRQAATAEAIKSLIDAGVIAPDEVLEGAVRQQFGLPPKDPNADPAPAVPEPEMLAAEPQEVTANYDPHQLRNSEGEWAKVPGGGAGDKLKLAGRIQLGPGEKLLSSRRLSVGDDSYDVALAEVHTPAGRQIRLGVITEAKVWAGGPNPDKQRRIAELTERIERIEDGDVEGVDADSGEYEQLEQERGDLRNDGPWNKTAVLTPQAVGELRAQMETGVAKGREHKKAYDAFWSSPEGERFSDLAEQRDLSTRMLRKTILRDRTDEQNRRIAEIEAAFDAEHDEEWARLEALAPDNEAVFVEGHVPGGPEGDLYYEVAGRDDGEGGWDVQWGIKPPGAGDDWYIGAIDDSKAVFQTPSQIKGLLKALAELESGDQPKSAPIPGVQATSMSRQWVQAHLPGLHDQKEHGRKKHSSDTPAPAAPAGPAEKPKPATRRRAPAARPTSPAPAASPDKPAPAKKQSPPAKKAAPAAPATPAAAPAAPPAPSAAAQPKTGADALKSAPIRDERTLEKVIGDEQYHDTSDAVSDYADQGYQHVNYALRSTKGDASSLPEAVGPDSGLIPSHYSKYRADKMVSGLDAAMAKSRLTGPVRVFRGISSPQKTFGDAWQDKGDNSGLEWVDHAYASTTVSEAAAKKFAGYGAGVRMNITVPAGTGAVGIKQPTGSRLASERELLLDRGQRYRVVADYVAPDGVRTLDVEVVRA